MFHLIQNRSLILHVYFMILEITSVIEIEQALDNNMWTKLESQSMGQKKRERAKESLRATKTCLGSCHGAAHKMQTR